MRIPLLLKASLLGAMLPALAQAQITVSSDITVSTTWTASNVYRLNGQIYVRNGATLTIEAGTVIASLPAQEGSLAIARGSQIFINGTEKNPVIFTSTNDVDTWAPLPGHPTGKNPKTGTWREAANEWGNLTILGRGFVSACPGPGYTGPFSPANFNPMEGLVANPALPGINEYGGGNDNDDSGTLKYFSLRYTGKVIGLGNELNGISLGGVGRETDIHHVELMNNVDDGIEIWGGTVNLRHFAIWNIGDDSLDVDQGWRGTAQFGLIVQGHSLNAASGSGVCDNICELDGAEAPSHEPVTRAAVFNVTFVGQPYAGGSSPRGGDHATAWRDNARVQFRNCIFMDVGFRIIGFDNASDGCGTGYTVPFNPLWSTPVTVSAQYPAQISPGFECEIRDSVFFRNNDPDAYTLSDALGVTSVPNAFNNVVEPATMPITALTRSAVITRGGRPIRPVTFLDPRPAGDALTSASFAPNVNGLEQAKFRGGFAPNNNWLCEWTASYAFGFTPGGWCDLGNSKGRNVAYPVLSGTGNFATGSTAVISTTGAGAPFGVLVLAFAKNPGGGLEIFGPGNGTIVPAISPFPGAIGVAFHPTSVPFNLGPIPPGFLPGTSFLFQMGVLDGAAGPSGVAFSNAIQYTL